MRLLAPKMATNTLKRSLYELWNYQKVPSIISVTSIHIIYVLVSKLVLNLKRTRSANSEDGLEIHSIVSPIWDKIEQKHSPSGFMVCQVEALDEKYWRIQLNQVEISRIYSQKLPHRQMQLHNNLDFLSCVGKTTTIKRLK